MVFLAMEKSPTPAELVESARRKMPHMRILDANEKESHRLAAMILAGISIKGESFGPHVMMGIPQALIELSRTSTQRDRALAWAKATSPEVAAMTEILFNQADA
jgi:hypothetical protein